MEELDILPAKGRPVAVYMQQMRALRAIFQRQQQLSGKNVVVIGGGIAGLTAAAAASLAGAKCTTVLERNDTLLSVQFNCYHRFLHPRIHEWPRKKSVMASAHLPILTWSAGTAHEVALAIRTRYLELEAALEGTLFHRTSVTDLNVDHKTKSIQFTVPHDKKVGRGQIDDVDLVIWANGFGADGEIDGVPPRPYWRSDSLAQAALRRGSHPYRILVAGEGDGGAIDVARARLRELDHGPFIDEAVQAVKSFANKIQQIDEEARAVVTNSESACREAAAELLQRRYAALDKDELQKISEFLETQLRQDVEVTWLARKSYPLDIGAFTFNRFIAWLLVHKGWVHSQRGRLSHVLPAEHKYAARIHSVTLKGEHYLDGPLSSEIYDEIIVHYPAKREREPAQIEVDPQAQLTRAEFEYFAELRRKALAQNVQRQRPKIVVREAEEIRKDTLAIGGEQTEEFPCMSIQLAIDDVPSFVEWVEYILHPDCDEVRIKVRGGAGSNYGRNIYTYDDYWVEARLSTGQAVQGEWLSNLLEGKGKGIKSLEGMRTLAERLGRDTDAFKNNQRPAPRRLVQHLLDQFDALAHV